MSEVPDILVALRRMKLVGADETPAIVPLTGGVSSDVYRVELAAGPICVKRALPKLRVAAEWLAPIERIHSEVDWFRFAGTVEPGCVPRILAEDKTAHLFAMNYFEPADYPGWKAQLLEGHVDSDFAGAVGRSIGAIHRASAGRADVAAKFAHDEMFMALRIEPYLLYTAKAHPDRAPRIEAMAREIASARIALMHGDVSPKNILVGREGPIFLDAETACYGDPAFDLAFCLNHLLLKCVWAPAHVSAYIRAFDALRHAYFAQASWESADGLDRRTAGLLSAFLLARVDGKSPVEYITTPAHKEFVRSAAREFLSQHLTLSDIAGAWHSKVSRL
ncbi:MAG TPA: aminoglycoside phosphotransferase family protein [Rhizomicrobium sp.]|nr:aminoglycoside phosphotransferase family protein [Rhizomicrobium sp.]